MMYFIAYDITDAKRLAQASRILEDYGLRVQYSFFQCEFEKTQLEALKKALLAVIDIRKDRLHIYPLCTDCLQKTLKIGKGDLFVPRSYEIL